MPDGIGQQHKGLNTVLMGVVTGAHGVRGLVRVKSFTADPSDLTAYGPLHDALARQSFAVTIKGAAKGQLLASIDGCSSRSQAEALRGTELFINRSCLPDDEDREAYYHTDLIGLDAVSPDGATLGTVRAIFDFGSGDMLEILGPDGTASLHPFTHAIVPEIDLAAGRLILIPATQIDGEEIDGEKIDGEEDS